MRFDATNCAEVQRRFSDYLDGAVTGLEMHGMAGHMETCEACRREFTVWRGVQGALAAAGALKAPADLGLKLRVAISHESARRQGHWWDPLAVRWDNWLRPALLQAGAGLAGAVLLVGGFAMLVGVVGVSGSVQANDEPLGAMSSPHYLYSSVAQQPIVMNQAGQNNQDIQDAPIVIEAKINAQGRVYDYTVLSGATDEKTLAQVRNQLMVQVYEPARVFGEAVRGRVLITFSGVSVRG